jgi:hypothetical protein
MATISITAVTGLGGSPPTSLLVSGTVVTCEQVEVKTSCSAAPVVVAIPTGGPNVWNAVLPNDKQCPCGATVDVTASCISGAKDTATATFTIVCAAAGSCLDDPDDVFGSDTCVTSLSKDVHGEIVLSASKRHVCKKTNCVTLRTEGELKVALANHAPCDGPIAQMLAGSLLVQKLATAYEKNGLGRGVHAGDFRWVSKKKDEIDGRISGITNGGLVRAAPFAPGIEKCVSEGILVGRLCGRVVKTLNPELQQAQVVATYRLHVPGTAKGENGAAIGTLEGVVITPC